LRLIFLSQLASNSGVSTSVLPTFFACNNYQSYLGIVSKFKPHPSFFKRKEKDMRTLWREMLIHDDAFSGQARAELEKRVHLTEKIPHERDVRAERERERES
jgi:hypothetical protein